MTRGDAGCEPSIGALGCLTRRATTSKGQAGSLTNGTRSVDLRQLRYFLAVADELNFGRAAQRLRIAGPSLSQQIKSLERDLKVQLFERNYHSVSLTSVGAALVPHAQALLAQADDLRRRATGLLCTQPIRLGLVDRFFAPWAERARSVAAVRVDTWVLPSHVQTRRVSTRSLDLAICHAGWSDLDALGLESHLTEVNRLHAVSVGSVPSVVKAYETAVLIEADSSSWSAWNTYAEEFADSTGALTVGIDDGGLAGGAFFAHVRRLRRPVLNCPKGPNVPLPRDMVQRPVVGPAPLWTWSVVQGQAPERNALF
jgi:DNA-binding transcriptional LysR family regulator